MPHTIAQLNGLNQADFVRVVGPVFEHSPWISEKAWPECPFADAAHLHRTLCRIVREADEENQLALIQAHPDLVGMAASTGTLTRESTQEQNSAGLNNLSPGEIQLFHDRNAAYRGKFGFPFVICARLNKKDAILRGFEKRLANSREEEIKTALEEIFKIAELRLQGLTHG